LNADRQITLREAAKRLNVHYMTAYRYVRTGRLTAHREGGQYQVCAAAKKHPGGAGPGRPAGLASRSGWSLGTKPGRGR
jgi:excisionase family DNA binding protein